MKTICYLRVFECLTYAHIKDGKLDPKVKKYIFLEYTYMMKGYRLWCIERRSQKFLVGRDMIFYEIATPL